ncbi:MAG: hypothetical protein IV090_18455 [Candidatus Sericytochromatia bacterium]|nr:hypothetical protein [Candidatus Sericytochromatia bacterium]
MKRFIALTAVLSVTSCSSPPTQTSSSQILKDLSKTLNDYIEQQKTQPSSAPTIQPSAKLSPTPLPTPTVFPNPTAVPIVLTTPIPTATPTIVATSDPSQVLNSISTPQINVPSGTNISINMPIPAGYPVPTGINKCRAYVGVTPGHNKEIGNDFDSEKVKKFDNQSIVPFKYSNVDSYAQIFYEYPSYKQNAVFVSTPSLKPGEYIGTFAGGSIIALYVSENVSLNSFDDFDTASGVSIKGSQDGYMWGKFVGFLGKKNNKMSVLGFFSCIP